MSYIVKKFCFVFFCVFQFFLLSIVCSNSNAALKPEAQKYEINGLPKALLENTEERLKISQATSPEAIEKEIILAVQPYGYFHAKITRIFVKSRKETSMIYQVDLGEPLRVVKKQVDIINQGKSDKLFFIAINNNSILKVNDIFTTPAYNAYQEKMFKTANNNGYIQAKMIRHEVYVNIEKNEASIYITFDTGRKFYYGPVTFSPSPYDLSFLKRFVSFSQGETYSSAAIAQLQEKFLKSKYFSSVAITPQVEKASENDEVPILIDTAAVKSQQYNFGVGYGTNTGARTSIGMDLYRVTDTGQHLSALLNLSTVTTSITTKYYIPGERPTIDQYVEGFYLGRFTPNAGTAYTRQLFSGYETKLNSLWSASANLNYLHERFAFNNDPYTTADLVYPSFNISRLSSDNAINPTNGTRVILDVAGSPVNTEEEFLKTELSAKWIFPPTTNNFVILRGDVGVIYANDYSQQFPLSMRFFAGGFNSVRGYSYQSLGPGKYLKVGSAEIQQRVYDEFFVGVFVDEGNASDCVTQPLERGIGLDFIYRTSVGPISIDIAQANTDPGKPLSIEFNFGANL